MDMLVKNSIKCHRMFSINNPVFIRSTRCVAKMAEQVSKHTVLKQKDEIDVSTENEDLCLPKPFLDLSNNHNGPFRNAHMNFVREKLFQNPHYGHTDDWERVWQGRAQFNPYKVPLDLRVGEAINRVPKPEKYSNLELAKIENFLHLTPKAIQEHCKNLKKFCTQWPAGLKSDVTCQNHYPLEYHTVDYVTAGQTQRNQKARIVTLKFYLYNLNLNEKARHKIIKLAGSRYDAETDSITIRTEKCPVRKQNKDYADYLLTVLYFEAQKQESWEDPKNRHEEDGIFYWEYSSSYSKLQETLPLINEYSGQAVTEEFIESNEKVKGYKNAVMQLKTTQLNPVSKHEDKMKDLRNYKKNVKKLYGL